MGSSAPSVRQIKKKRGKEIETEEKEEEKEGRKGKMKGEEEGEEKPGGWGSSLEAF